MDILSIAQILTGSATLVVAIVLIWQFRLQNEELKISHKDAENNLSLESLTLLNNHFYLTLQSEFAPIYQKRFQGKDGFSEEEWDKYKTWSIICYGIFLTEWRLGRLSGTKYTFNNFRTVMSNKAGLEFYREIGRDRIHIANFGDMSLLETTDEIYEEFSSEKLKD